MLTHSGEKPFQCGTCDYNNVHTEAIYKDVCTYIMERSPSNVKYVVISLHQEMFYKYIWRIDSEDLWIKQLTSFLSVHNILCR